VPRADAAHFGEEWHAAKHPEPRRDRRRRHVAQKPRAPGAAHDDPLPLQGVQEREEHPLGCGPGPPAARAGAAAAARCPPAARPLPAAHVRAHAARRAPRARRAIADHAPVSCPCSWASPPASPSNASTLVEELRQSIELTEDRARPRATQVSGSSASRTSRSISSWIARSRPRSSEPPPASVMPVCGRRQH
jgi:hypothetical protein